MKKFLVFMLFVVLVVAGCSSSPQGNNQAQTSGQNNAQNTGGQQNTQTGTNAGVNANANANAGTGLSAYKTLAQAMQAGVGVHCTGTETVNNTQVQYDIWADNGMMKVGSTMGGQSTVAVMKDNKVYVQMNSELKAQAPNCDWLTFESNSSSGSDVSSQDESYKSPDSVVMADYDCTEQNVANSEFDTSGNACTMNDIMKGMMPDNMPSGGQMPPGY